MLDTTNVDKPAVFSAENAFAENLSRNGLDASPGTALRELVVRPEAVMRSLEDAWREELLSSLNLREIASGVVKGDDSLVDALASIYRIRRRGGAASSGTIALDIDYTGSNVYVNRSISFTAQGHRLTFSGVYVGSPDGTAGDGSSNRVRLVRYPNGMSADGRTVTYTWSMLLPVTCEDGANIAAGTVVEVNGPSGQITSAFVFSPITGGGDRETNQELASRILEAVPPGVMSTPLQIRNAFSEEYGIPPSRVAVLGGQDGLERAYDPVTGLTLPGFVEVFVAAEGDCPVETLEASVEASSMANYWDVYLDPPASSGVYEIVSVAADGTVVTSVDIGPDWGTRTLPSNHILTPSTARFSSYQSVHLRIFHESATTPSVTLTVRRQPCVGSMQAMVDSDSRRAPGQDVVVKAASPFFMNASITVEGGSGVGLDTMKAAICDKVNSIPVGRGYVSGQDIMDALSPLGVKLAFPISLAARTIVGDGSASIVSSDGRLDMGRYSDGRGVFYLSSENLQVTTNES